MFKAITDEQACDVIVSGGGLNGLTLAIALADAGMTVTVIDRLDPAVASAAPFDGRATAIARGSQQMMAAIGLWPHAEAAACPIREIRVSDGALGRPASSLFLHYDCAELGEAEGGRPLGYIVENQAIRLALYARAEALPSLTLLAPAEIVEAERGAAGVSVVLSDGQRLRAPLLVAAEGRNSSLREAAGIGVTTWDYPQSGLVATLHHSLPHENVAHEHFLPSGPFAVLPMTGAPDGTPRSSLVWTEGRELAARMTAVSPDRFSAEVQRRFGDSLGQITLAGQRWCYPLSLLHAERYVDRRLALIGDAAHVIHPIAGQGLNLGLRDIAALAEVLVDARRLGLDIGGPTPLSRYERWRRSDTLTLIVVTDGLNRLFSNDLPPLRLARDLGLAAVGRVPPLKRLFMRHAMGLVGDLPRLLTGAKL